MCGCIRGSRTTDNAANRRSRRVAACRSIRTPRVLSRIGPLTRLSADGAFDGPADRWRRRYQDDTAALPKDPQDSVTVFLAEVADVGSSRLEDSEPEKAEHCD
jgi:hypothetical protein